MVNKRRLIELPFRVFRVAACWWFSMSLRFELNEGLCEHLNATDIALIVFCCFETICCLVFICVPNVSDYSDWMDIYLIIPYAILYCYYYYQVHIISDCQLLRIPFYLAVGSLALLFVLHSILYRMFCVKDVDPETYRYTEQEIDDVVLMQRYGYIETMQLVGISWLVMSSVYLSRDVMRSFSIILLIVSILMVIISFILIIATSVNAPETEEQIDIKTESNGLSATEQDLIQSAVNIVTQNKGNLSADEIKIKVEMVQLINESDETKTRHIMEYMQKVPGQQTGTSVTSVNSHNSNNEESDFSEVLFIFVVVIYGCSFCGFIVTGIVGLASGYDPENQPKDFSTAITVMFFTCLVSCILSCGCYAYDKQK